MGIDQPFGIAVIGQATARAEPDHAVIRFAVNRLAGQPSQALDEARATTTAARRSLRDHGVADDDVESSRTNVQSLWDGHGHTRRLAGHQCRIELAARVRSLDAVEPCLVDLVEAGADEILGVGYDTSRRDELLADARRRAVERATATAALYAEAAGVRLGPVVHLDDTNPVGARSGLAARAAMSMPEADGDPTAPGSITVEASVLVGFAIAP